MSVSYIWSFVCIAAAHACRRIAGFQSVPEIVIATSDKTFLLYTNPKKKDYHEGFPESERRDFTYVEHVKRRFCGGEHEGD